MEALQTRPELFGSAFKDNDKKQRRTVLVPGCGRGYDVSLFASYGFNAVGLDISPTSTEEARKIQNDIDLEFRYPVQDASAGRGEARFITGDFFGQSGFAPSASKPTPHDSRRKTSRRPSLMVPLL